MKEFIADISDLKHPERNVRIHTEKQIKEMQRSIEMFGQLRPIVIDEDNFILAGNGIVQAMREMGTKKAKVLQKDGLTESQKKKLMLADNKIFSLGLDDMDTVFDFISELDDLDVPGFDEDILESMVMSDEEVTEMISDYGSLGEEDIELRNKRRERVIRSEDSTGSEDSIGSEEAAGVGQEKKKEENNLHLITCPHCSEEIWL